MSSLHPSQAEVYFLTTHVIGSDPYAISMLLVRKTIANLILISSGITTPLSC